MNRHDLGAIAAAAKSVADRPGTAIVHDHGDGRLVVFRLEPGQRVATHTSESSVFLFVVSGGGFVVGAAGEEAVGPGTAVAFAPREPHGIRADRERLVVAGLITPRPGAR